MSNITVEFKEEKKIVRFPDGSSSEYPKAKIEGHKQELIKRKQLIERQIADLDKDLGDIETAKVEAAKTTPVGEEPLG
jgi:hypothetical protein